ncbi:MAG: pyrroline-5-carboxylate reductase [Nannocystaceae bacterium]|nr:pyrroline-5-carboxylate reductase [Nannocystaceae bacterium]
MADELAILGCGTMGEAILGGLLHERLYTPEQVVVTVRRAEAGAQLQQRHGVVALRDNVEACSRAQVVLVAVKPQYMAELLDDDRMRAAIGDKLVISIAAGVRLATLGTWLPAARLIRAMPNTPCLVSRGMTVLAPGPRAGADELAVARRIFHAVGRVIELEDKHMDAVTSLNGSGPAFAYVMLEALADGGVMMGLRRDVALEIAASVFLGAATMVLDTKLHPAALKDQVTTPAGSTIAGLLTMEDGRIRSVLARTIQEATKVAASLGPRE